MKISPYIRIFVTSIPIGIGVGFFGSFLVGLYLMQSYHKYGPNDPADAPAMVAMGLILLGTGAGAVVGLVIGVIRCVRLARRKPADQPI
jgi:hypothetical protein